MTDLQGLEKARRKIEILKAQLKTTSHKPTLEAIKAKIARLHNLFTTEPK